MSHKPRFAVLIALFAVFFFALFTLSAQKANAAEYTVQQGDSLATIAQSQLGDENRWIDIYDLNKDLVSDPNTVYNGMRLQVPLLQLSAPVSDISLGSDQLPTNIVTQSVQEVQIVKKVFKPVVAVASTTFQTPAIAQAPSLGTGEAVYDSVINAAAMKHHVDSGLMKRMLACESGFNPNARNASGASGIAQFMYGTYMGSWNYYNQQYSYMDPIGQIYAMALKIQDGDATAWSCYRM